MSVRNSRLVPILALAAACTTAAPPPSAQGVAVRIDPPAATLPPGGTARFTATVTGTALTSVTWTVQEGPGCGSVGSDGAYVAPAAPATCHVVATSLADPAVAFVASVTVTTGAAALGVEPATATVDACAAQAFAATGFAAGDVSWRVEEPGGGAVTDGAYVAPAIPGTYHVVASSRADPSRAARATVTVGPERVLSVAVNPVSQVVAPGGSQAFAAAVTTTCGTFAAR